MIPFFEPKVSIEENWRNADGINLDFAAWLFTSEEHREDFRDSGKNAHRSQWLRFERMRNLIEALADGELIGMGIPADDENSAVVRIPRTIFAASDVRFIAPDDSTISGLNRKFLDVRICRAVAAQEAKQELEASIGRPSILDMMKVAWDALKMEDPDFATWPKTAQNLALRDEIARLNPGKYPGNSTPGDSTIRKHRRNHPERFS